MNPLKEFPAYFFHFFSPTSGDANVRTVHAIKEDKWVFCSKSKTLAIEDLNNYKKRKISDRINNEIILSYLLKAGYNLRDKNFFHSAHGMLRFKG